jgi:hypothetical protein
VGILCSGTPACGETWRRESSAVVLLGGPYGHAMKSPSPDERRLADLLVEPRETLNVELKSWVDIANNNEHKALLAKAIIALANHGGGFVLIGFENTDTGSGPASGRPASLGAFNTDAINAIVSRFCDPKFHCDISIQVGPDGLGYPIIVVPGGHRVPIRQGTGRTGA